MNFRMSNVSMNVTLDLKCCFKHLHLLVVAIKYISFKVSRINFYIQGSGLLFSIETNLTLKLP